MFIKILGRRLNFSSNNIGGNAHRSGNHVLPMRLADRRHVVAVIAIGRQWNYFTKLSNNVHQYKINDTTRMWANAQPDGRPAEHRWRSLFNAA